MELIDEHIKKFCEGQTIKSIEKDEAGNYWFVFLTGEKLRLYVNVNAGSSMSVKRRLTIQLGVDLIATPFNKKGEVIPSVEIEKRPKNKSKKVDNLIDDVFKEAIPKFRESFKKMDEEEEKKAKAARRSLKCAGHPELCDDELDEEVDMDNMNNWDPLNEY